MLAAKLENPGSASVLIKRVKHQLSLKVTPLFLQVYLRKFSDPHRVPLFQNRNRFILSHQPRRNLYIHPVHLRGFIAPEVQRTPKPAAGPPPSLEAPVGSAPIILKNTHRCCFIGNAQYCTIVEQLLNRGVSPNTGPEKLALSEAVEKAGGSGAV